MQYKLFHLHAPKTKILFLAWVLCLSTFSLHAAGVHSTKPDNRPIHLLDSEANDFTGRSQESLSSDTGKMLSLSTTPGKTNPLETAIPLKASGKDKARSFQQYLMFEYGDNALVQESLYSLVKAKHLWGDLDALAYEFTDEVLYTLKFDQLIEVDRYKHKKQIKHKNVSKNIYDKARRVQKSSKSRASGYKQNAEESILSHLFRKQTLYYLLALLIIVSILARFARFILGFFP